MGKRKNGEGTWGTKEIHGTTYKYYRNSNGKYFYGKTEKEIIEKKEKYELSNTIEKVNNNTLFYDYIISWIQNVKRISIESTTYDRCIDIANSMIRDYKPVRIGDMELKNLSSKLMQKYVNSLATKYSKGTITKLFNVIRPCMKYALDNNDISEDIISIIVMPSEANVAVKEKDIKFITIKGEKPTPLGVGWIA